MRARRTTTADHRHHLRAVPAEQTAAIVLDYEHDHVFLVCLGCHSADENGALEDIIQLSHGPLPVELAEEWFSEQGGKRLVLIPDQAPVMGYCWTCQARTRLEILTEQQVYAAHDTGRLRVSWLAWDDEDE